MLSTREPDSRPSKPYKSMGVSSAYNSISEFKVEEGALGEKIDPVISISGGRVINEALRSGTTVPLNRVIFPDIVWFSDFSCLRCSAQSIEFFPASKCSWLLEKVLLPSLLFAILILP